jgi:hypothetical protein
MTKVILNAKYYGREENGANPQFFGFEGWIEDGNLVGEVPEDLLPVELAAGRVRLFGAPVVAPVAAPLPADPALLAEIDQARQAT